MAQINQNQKLPTLSPRVFFVLSLLFVIVIPFLTGALLSWHSLGELDVWLHQKAGQDLLSGKGFTGLNSYSYMEPEHSWTNHEWLFQVLVAVTGPGKDDLPAGIHRWNILRLLLTLSLMALLLVGDRPWRAPPGNMIWLAPAILLGVLLLWPRILLRPELVSYGLMVLLVRLAEIPCPKSWNFRQLLSFKSREFLAFVVTLVWAQMHGFSSLAPFIWLLAGILGLIPRSGFPRTSISRLFAGTALLFVALFLTPNGWQGLIYPLIALGQFSSNSVDLNSTISELQPLLQTPDGFSITLLAFKASLIWGVFQVVLSWRRRNLLRTVLWALAAVAALMAQRNLGIYAVTFILLLTEASGHKEFYHFPWKLSPPPALFALPVLGALAFTLWFWPAIITDQFYLGEGQSRRFGSGPTAARFPFQAVEILSRQPETRVFANVDAASISLSLGQALVFIDGRTEAYSPEHWVKYGKLQKAGPESLEILNESGTRDVLLTLGGGSFHSLLKTLIQSPDWMLRHADTAGVLLRRPEKQHSSMKPTLASFAILQAKPADPFLSPTRQADLYAAQATLLSLSGQMDMAEERLQQGLNVCPKHPLLNHNLGNQLMQKGENRAAYEHFNRALATNPRLGGSAMNAGVCLMKLQDFSGAEKMFRRTCQLQPENYQSWANHSLALQQLGEYRKALMSLEEAARLNPSNLQLKKALTGLRQKL